MKFFASTEHKSYEFDIEKDATGYIISDSNGKRLTATLELIDNNRYSMILNNESFIVNAKKESDEYTTIIRGKQFEMNIDDEKSKSWKSILEKSGSNSKESVLKSPMPGLVVKVLVKEGQEVKKGEAILVLSAMKMENEIKASSDGTVSKISCEENKAVEKGEVLIKF